MDTNTKAVLLAAIISITIIFCSYFKSRRIKGRVYVDKTWRGYNIEHFKFINNDGSSTIFVIFSGLKDRLGGSEVLDLEAEMEDIGVIPMFPKKDIKDLPIVYLIDRNNGYKYKYCGKYAKIKFERLK